MTRRKVSEVKIKRSVLRNMKRSTDISVKQAGIGEDYGRLLFGGQKETGDIAVAAGLCMPSALGYVKADFIRLFNGIAAGGFEPFALSDIIMLPSDNEAQLKAIVKELTMEAETHGVTVISGHTETGDMFGKPAVALALYGRRPAGDRQFDSDITRLQPGNDIVMCGVTGALGTVETAKLREKDLLKRYSADYLRPVFRLEDGLYLNNQAKLAASGGAVYAHDISVGGVFAALWEMADGAGCGIEILHDAIPILQETIEICEFTGKNPYMMDGSGAVLYVTETGQKMVDVLRNDGYEAAVIGKITSDNDRVVVHDEERRFLTPPKYLQTGEKTQC